MLMICSKTQPTQNPRLGYLGDPTTFTWNIDTFKKKDIENEKISENH